MNVDLVASHYKPKQLINFKALSFDVRKSEFWEQVEKAIRELKMDVVVIDAPWRNT